MIENRGERTKLDHDKEWSQKYKPVLLIYQRDEKLGFFFKIIKNEIEYKFCEKCKNKYPYYFKKCPKCINKNSRLANSQRIKVDSIPDDSNFKA